MYRVDFINENRSIDVEEGSNLLDVIRNSEIDINTPCNGSGTCGKCKVIAHGKLSDPSSSELEMIDVKKNERLSCMAKICGDLKLEIPIRNKEIKTINRGYSVEVDIDSFVKTVKLPKIDRSNPIPYADIQRYNVETDSIYKKISMLDLDSADDIWGVVFEESLIDLGFIEQEVFGVAVDIGTTGISYYLVDLKSGEIRKKFSSLNPQTKFGSDVLTRITYCMDNEEGAKNLQKLIVDEINISIKKLAELSDIKLDSIYHIFISANTTMMHLLLAINPESMAKSPYRPIFLKHKNFKSKEIGIVANNESILSIIPAASSYIGGDILSGLAAIDFSSSNNAIFIDIGTNGELAAFKDNRIICTSTAAGPALEGMNIECGLRAESGAIESFKIDDEFNIMYKTIGDADAIGICGSGLIDIAAQLVEKNILTKSGRWNKNLNEKIAHRLKEKRFYITEKVYISQKDIRQIQLAKGAISTGIIMMSKEIGLELGEVSKVYIAGAFGYHVDPDSMKTIGLIPKEIDSSIEFLGNTSLEGARLALLNRGYVKNIDLINNNIEVLELSLKPEFQEEFIGQLNF